MWGSSPEEEDAVPEVVAELRRWSRDCTLQSALVDCEAHRSE